VNPTVFKKMVSEMELKASFPLLKLKVVRGKLNLKKKKKSHARY